MQDTVIVADITDTALEASERGALFAVIPSAASCSQRIASDLDIGT